jgi:hypothetical protein
MTIGVVRSAALGAAVALALLGSAVICGGHAVANGPATGLRLEGQIKDSLKAGANKSAGSR